MGLFMHATIEATKCGDVATIKKLIYTYGLFEPKSPRGRFPLPKALENGPRDIAEFLLDPGARVTCSSKVSY